MARTYKTASGKRVAKVGTRLQVWNGTADKTSGGLTKSDLTKSSSGKVVSKKMQAHGRRWAANLTPCLPKGKHTRFSDD